jgi:predicted nucleotide-binding protein
MGAIARCKLFVGSSKEGRDLAYAVRQQLKDVAEVDIWSDGIFEVGESGLGSLISALKKYDFAVLVLTPDDETISRGRKESAPRDNVIFEAGMFIGKLGSSRTFLLYDSEGKPKIPSDLAGITLAPFVPRSGGGLQAAVGEAVDDIRDKIKNLAPL